MQKMSNLKLKEFGLIIFILIAAVFIQFNNSNFMTVGNILNLLNNTSLLGIMAVGMMGVLLTGGIDLSVGSIVALSGMTSAVINFNYPQIPIVIIILIGMLVGLCSGILVGLLVSKGGVIPIIASLGVMNVLRGLTYVVGNNQWVSAHQMSPGFKALTTNNFLGIDNLIWIVTGVILLAFYFFNYSRTGRGFYAVGSNMEATKITGINKDRILLTAYSLNGLLCGLVGTLWVSRYASAQGDTAVGYEMNVIAACVLGGISVSGGEGKVSGLIIGTVMLGILNNALPLLNVSTFWEDAITGIIILVAILSNLYLKRNSDKKDLKRRGI